jgi:TRAP-type C4-dicarboxylate transport system substrate-binding protein
MRTTVDLPDAIFRQAKARAALDGMTLKELITGFVVQGLRGMDPQSAGERQRTRSEPPIARPATGRPLPRYSNAELYELLDEP